MNFEMRSPTAPAHAPSTSSSFSSLSLFFSITRPPMRHLRGHVAITQLPTTWQLGQERGLIAEHQAVFASVFSVLGRNFCVGRRRNSVSLVATLFPINFASRTFSKTNRTFLSDRRSPELAKLSQPAPFPSANRLIGEAAIT